MKIDRMDTNDFFLTQLGFNNEVVNKNTEDITNEESLLFHSGANCVNWLLGHIIYGRNLVLKLLGTEPVWDEEKMKCYSRGIKAIDHKELFILFEDLKILFSKSFEKITETVTNADLSTVEKDLAGLALHEIYHSGQIGYCRRLLGKEGKIK